MKAVILCGGKGTRLGDRGRAVPKALIPIGGRPIIWHLLSIYAAYGVRDFVLCLGFLGDEIRRYFEENPTEWNIQFADTGVETNTGGRLRQVRQYVEGDEQFFATYGDGLADIDINSLLEFHRSHGRTGTVTAVHPFSNFGIMDVGEDNSIIRFREKPVLKEWINGGFFVFGTEIFEVLDKNSILEREPFEALSARGQLKAFRHEGFWKCMDTFKDNLEFEQLWAGRAPWKSWE